MLMIPTRARGRATGFALITALVMLLVITLLAIGGARLAIDSKRMSRNQRDTDIAFQAAEAALRDAEYDIQNASAGNGTATNTRSAIFDPTKTTGFPGSGCNTGGPGTATPYQGLCQPAPDGATAVWNTVSWSTSGTPQTVGFGDFTGRTFPTGTGLLPAQKPRYIIEILPDRTIGGNVQGPATFLYRITAVGWGPNLGAQVMLQSVYRKTDAPG